jgi:hypothetical protein
VGDFHLRDFVVVPFLVVKKAIEAKIDDAFCGRRWQFPWLRKQVIGFQLEIIATAETGDSGTCRSHQLKADISQDAQYYWTLPFLCKSESLFKDTRENTKSNSRGD